MFYASLHIFILHPGPQLITRMQLKIQKCSDFQKTLHLTLRVQLPTKELCFIVPV